MHAFFNFKSGKSLLNYVRYLVGGKTHEKTLQRKPD